MLSDTDASLICRHQTPQETRQGVPTFLRGLEPLQHSPMKQTHMGAKTHCDASLEVRGSRTWDKSAPFRVVLQGRPCLPGEATYSPAVNGSRT
jgi:hypothetical protein